MGWNMSEEIIGEHRGAPEKKITNVGVAGWFVTLFARPISVRVTLDRFTKFELRRGWYLGKRRPRFVRQGEAGWAQLRRRAAGRLRVDLGGRACRLGARELVPD